MTCSCNSLGGVEPKLVLNCKRNTLIGGECCKTCGGKFFVDGIAPASAKKPSTVGLEVTNSMNPEINWENVKKGRRSRTSVARRSFNVLPKVGNTSPTRVGDFSGSDSDKFGELFLGASGKAEALPIKKRSGLLRSPSPSSAKLGDFFGIELLAAAASIIRADADNANKEEFVAEDSSMQKNSDAPSFAAQSVPVLKCDDPGSSLSNLIVQGDNTEHSPVLNNSDTASQSLCGSSKNENMQDTVPVKVNRLHWDLNTVMDAWDEPYDDSIAQNAPTDVINGDTRMEIEGNTLKAVSPDRICIDSPNPVDQMQATTDKDAVMKTSNPVVKTAILGSSLSEGELTRNKADESDVTVNDMQAIETAVDVQRKDSEDSLMTFEPAGTFIQVGQSVADPAIKHENGDIPHKGSQDFIMEDLSKSYNSAGAQCVDSTKSARFEEGCDSPYEDGELRGSSLYSWEENDLGRECVDYESDGRNEDEEEGSDAADYHPGSEIVQGGTVGSEGSNGTERKIVRKRFPEDNGSESESFVSLRTHFVKDESKSIEISGNNKKESNGTFEQSVIIEENDGGGKPRQQHLTDHRVDQNDASKMARGTDGKNVFFNRDYNRSRRPSGSYSRPERDFSPDKYPSRYNNRAATNNRVSERSGVDQWNNHWGTRRPYNNTSNYQGGPRSVNNDSGEKFGGGLDFHDQRQQTPNYQSRSFRRSSPVGRDDCFNDDAPRRRIPITREFNGGYRNRGGHHHYSQNGGRDFVQDFDRPNNYIPRKERNFFPNQGRGGGTHMPMKRPRSRSRSRTRSPSGGAWHYSRREQRNHPDGSRRQINNRCSPDFRSGPNNRMRAPFTKPEFVSDYRNNGGYNNMGPRQNSRWVDDDDVGDRNFEDRRSSRRSSPPPHHVGDFRRRSSQRFVDIVKADDDDYFSNRPVIRPRRFPPFMDGGGDRECKFKNARYEDRRRGGGGGGGDRVENDEEGGGGGNPIPECDTPDLGLGPKPEEIKNLTEV